jgi:hypothetical protein
MSLPHIFYLPSQKKSSHQNKYYPSTVLSPRDICITGVHRISWEGTKKVFGPLGSSRRETHDTVYKDNAQR